MGLIIPDAPACGFRATLRSDDCRAVDHKTATATAEQSLHLEHRRKAVAARHILYVNGRLYVDGRKCDGCIFGRDGWRIVDAGMVAGTCHKLDDERFLRTVVVIGVLEPREDPPKK
jgi:hypothetical protein